MLEPRAAHHHQFIESTLTRKQQQQQLQEKEDLHHHQPPPPPYNNHTMTSSSTTSTTSTAASTTPMTPTTPVTPSSFSPIPSPLSASSSSSSSSLSSSSSTVTMNNDHFTTMTNRHNKNLNNNNNNSNSNNSNGMIKVVTTTSIRNHTNNNHNNHNHNNGKTTTTTTISRLKTMTKHYMSSPLTQLAMVILVSLCLLALVFLNLPRMKNESDWKRLRLPRSIVQVRDVAQVLSQYTEQSYFRVLSAIFCLYIFLQTFSVPGTIFLNVLCGALFGLPVAFVVTLLAGTLGASCSYLLSALFGKKLLQAYFSDKLDFFRSQIEKHREDLFYFMLFLRISPMLPNWFINACSPILQVPFSYFFGATLIGIAPQTAISVNIGVNLLKFVDVQGGSAGNPFINTGNVLMLFGIAALSLLPVVLKKRTNTATAA